MELRYVISKDKVKNTATMLLYGDIGDKIDGDQFANEINYLSENYDEIVIRINSGGGSVIQGLSIFSAMLNSKAFIISQIDGIAASMAGVIAMGGNEIRMNDFARIMVHNPYNPASNNLTKKEQKTIDNLKDMLSSILSRRGFDKDKMNKLMNEETWFTAKEALENKLIDSIIQTGKAPAIENALSGIAAQQITSEIFNNYLITPKNNMEILAKALGLSASATEVEILAEVKALQLKNSALETKQTELQKIADELKAEKETAQKLEVAQLVENTIKDGFFTAEQKDELIAMGETSFDTFKKMINSLKKPVTSLSATLKDAQNSASNEVTKDFDWYRKNDPQALAKIEKEQPEIFAKMYNAWEAKA